MNHFLAQAHEVRVRALHADPQRFVDRFPDDAMGLGCLVSRKMLRCDWKDLDKYIEHLRQVIATTQEFTEPVFNLIGTTQEEQYINMCRYTEWRYAGRIKYKECPKKANAAKLRIGYLSTDFHEHATCYLLASLFEHHDMEKFDVFIYSCGHDDNSPTRERIKKAVGSKFRDLRGLTIEEAVNTIKIDDIDILVDLKGYTTGNCMDIVAQRPAPLIAHYLGYPCTTGGMCDYIIADNIVIPDENSKYFSEKIIWLSGCYQINDDRCEISPSNTRDEYNLPESGTIYANFNQQYKIMPHLWSRWMEIMRKDEGSVLWQYIQGNESHEILKEHAKFYCVDPARILKASHIARPDHLARFRHVDLFLDTQPVSGHTTMSDAIRMGVKCEYGSGNTFISNVAKSLQENKGTLFDAKSKTKQIEEAYEMIWERHSQGLEPINITV